MGDKETYTEVTKTSWLQRLGGSIKSVGVGFLLFIAAFPVLWKNEGCAVKVAQGLTQGAAEVISLPEPKVDLANNGKLIHFYGDAITDEVLTLYLSLLLFLFRLLLLQLHGLQPGHYWLLYC